VDIALNSPQIEDTAREMPVGLGAACLDGRSDCGNPEEIQRRANALYSRLRRARDSCL
jgi:hypothetical protein